MRWFEKQRRAFICNHLASHGWVGRKPIMEYFGISTPQASTDLRKLQEDMPELMEYNYSSKRYEIKPLPSPPGGE